MNQEQEMELTRRFFADAEFQYTSLVSGDKPDITAVIDGRNIGIEVTHADDKSTTLPGKKTLRQEGVENARANPDQPYTMAIPLFPYAMLEARINDKIAKAQNYNLEHFYELWLLISAQLPLLEALPATYVIPLSVSTSTTKLDELFHDKLLASRFSHVYLHLNLDHAIISWDRSRRWQVMRSGRELDTSGREALDMLRQKRTNFKLE